MNDVKLTKREIDYIGDCIDQPARIVALNESGREAVRSVLSELDYMINHGSLDTSINQLVGQISYINYDYENPLRDNGPTFKQEYPSAKIGDSHMNEAVEAASGFSKHLSEMAKSVGQAFRGVFSSS